MNFFEYQEAARRQTSRLIGFYLLAVLLIILALYLATAFIIHGDTAFIPNQPLNWPALWDPHLLGIVALFTGGVILIGSLYKIISLSSGGQAVAEMLGGRPITPDTEDFHEKRLLNVVEEMAIASGTPIPRVFVMDDEEAINAFAAGFSTRDAVIAVTRGALLQLNREELQGVIGHEFSHILNGDMRMNIRLIGVLHGILLIALIGYFLVRILGRASTSGSRGKKGNPLAVLVLLGLAMMVIGYIGVFFARLIKSAVSRQREYLADASAVQFTRNPTGLAGALKKIGDLASGSRLTAPSAESASHLFFANGIASSFLGLLATHPPLQERIRRLDPEFTRELVTSAGMPRPTQAEGVSQLAADSPPPPPLPAPLSTVSSSLPAAIVSQAGTLPASSLTHAAEAIEAIHAPLWKAAHNPAMAKAVLYGILLDTRPELLQQQLTYLATRLPIAHHTTLDMVVEALRTLPATARQPLVDVAIGTLKHLPAAEYPHFRETIMELVRIDSEISLFEYMVLRMILRQLDTRFGIAKPVKTRLTSLNTVTQETATVLSALAWFGSESPDGAQKAFQTGCAELGHPNLRLLPPQTASLAAMDKALDRLVMTTPPVKQQLVAACTAAISSDGSITLAESDALRAVADALECPLPRL